ncbi:MAG: hypothetical protein J3Q66DRAFT_403977 [Benniella sp.]|nr:MAG: hypothetical protein J3Q66DRAFT_403977 [Benniella sp.]
MKLRQVQLEVAKLQLQNTHLQSQNTLLQSQNTQLEHVVIHLQSQKAQLEQDLLQLRIAQQEQQQQQYPQYDTSYLATPAQQTDLQNGEPNWLVQGLLSVHDGWGQTFHQWE